MKGLSNYYKCSGAKNQERKYNRPLPLQLAIINVYKIDENTCIAAENVSYRLKDEEKVPLVDKGNVTWYSIQIEWLNMVLQTVVPIFFPLQTTAVNVSHLKVEL